MPAGARSSIGSRRGGIRRWRRGDEGASNPPRDGEGDHAKHGGGGGVQGSNPPPSALRAATTPSRGGFMIRLYDTMTREKRPFVPLNPQRITMYVCGPTVYGRAHIGNARPAVVFDTIERLIEDGNAYEAQGHVLFHVPSDPDYGVLSRRDREAMLAGARVEVAPYKRDPADFVLWKPSAEAVVGWDSPWGRGRPGWHVECSAMIERHLGETIDIHGGGLDLIFPHHENEIAQSRCAHGGLPLARFWVHNGFVDMGAEKMSKSIGNIVTPNELLAQGHRGETLRLALLSAHYRQPLPWTERLVAQAKTNLDRLYRSLGDAEAGAPDERVV